MGYAACADIFGRPVAVCKITDCNAIAAAGMYKLIVAKIKPYMRNNTAGGMKENQVTLFQFSIRNSL